MYRKFIDAADGLEIPLANIYLMNDKIDFLRRRRKMLSKRSVFRAAVFVLLNMRHYPTFRNALSDVYAMISLRK